MCVVIFGVLHNLDANTCPNIYVHENGSFHYSESGVGPTAKPPSYADWPHSIFKQKWRCLKMSCTKWQKLMASRATETESFIRGTQSLREYMTVTNGNSEQRKIITHVREKLKV